MASVPAFCQQRQKLLPETMDFLFHSFNDSFSSLETYRGFRLLACDKSDLAIAYTPDDKDTYRRHNSLERHEKGYNQLHLNALYGGLNVLMATLDGNTKTLLPVSELPCILSLIQ